MEGLSETSDTVLRFSPLPGPQAPPTIHLFSPCPHGHGLVISSSSCSRVGNGDDLLKPRRGESVSSLAISFSVLPICCAAWRAMFFHENPERSPCKMAKNTLKHVEEWKNQKNNGSEVQHLAKSALQSFVAPLFIPYFCWRLGHQLLPPRAAVAGWRVG